MYQQNLLTVLNYLSSTLECFNVSESDVLNFFLLMNKLNTQVLPLLKLEMVPTLHV